jgi:hypothetical protein
VQADLPLFSAVLLLMEKWQKDFSLKLLTLGISDFRVALLTS